MMHTVPSIIVTAHSNSEVKPYLELLEKCGAELQVFLPNKSLVDVNPMENATALMLTGGEDIDARNYNKAGISEDPPAIGALRDVMELSLIQYALGNNFPVFAIGRGMQLLNVAFGGTLLPNIAGHRGESRDGSTWEPEQHMVYLSPGSKLAAIMGSGGFMRLNSIHHQGLREAQKSPELLAVAYSLGDGIIEALESPAHDWVIGMQSHPERVSEVPNSFRRVFQAFVERATMARDRRASA